MNTKAKNLFLFVVLLCSMLCFGVTSEVSAQSYSGQCKFYTAQNFSGGFSSIYGQGGTSNIYTASSSYSYGYANYSTVALPFDFNYDSVTYTAGSTFYTYWNGAVGFAANGNYNYGNGISNANFPNLIMPWSHAYACTVGGGSGGGIYYQTTGLPGSRVFTIEYKNYAIYGYYGYYYGYTMGMQVKMYEGTNNIEFLYNGNNQYMYYGYKSSIGINGNPSSSDYKAYQTATDFNFSTYYSPATNIRYLCPLKPLNVQLSTSPKTIDYGAQSTGFTTNANVGVTHVGTEGTLTILASTLVGIVGNPDFTVVSIPPNPIGIGASDVVTVAFTPIADGPRTAILTIKSNGKDSANQTINLKGIGLAPLIGVDTNIRFKKTLTKMGATRTETVIIKDIGSAALYWTAFPISGIEADQYVVTRFPANPIPPGGKDSLWITYVPTREGQHAATLTLQTNALNKPNLDIALIGRSTLPHIVVTSPLMSFDSVGQGDTLCRNLTIYNPGSDTLILSNNLMVSNEGDFLLTPLSGTHTSIAPDKTEVINVCFAPRQAGTRSGRFVLQTNIIPTFEPVRRDTAGTVLVDFTGNGVPFGVFAQSLVGGTNDSALIGTQVCRPDTIKNNGDADILVKSWAITGTDKSDFAVSGATLPFTLKARSTKVVTICGTPSAKGLRNGTLTLNGTSNGRNLALTAPLRVFGQNVCATPAPGSLFTDHKVVENSDSTMCVTVTNCGNVPATYTATLPNGADYALVAPTTSPVVAPGATTTFCVKFHPVARGLSNGTMVISTANLTDISVPLAGVGACANVIADAPTIPAANAGGHTTFTVNIQNSGNYDWTPGTPVITPNDGIYTLGAITTITAGGNIAPTVKYDPKDINKLYTAKITFPNAVPACATALEINLSQSTGATSVRQNTEQDGFALGQNYPNPFGGLTSFTYTTPTESVISLTVSDITGKVVKTISNGRISSGEHIVTLDANELTSGTYIVTLASGTVTLTRQIVVAK